MWLRGHIPMRWPPARIKTEDARPLWLPHRVRWLAHTRPNCIPEGGVLLVPPQPP